MFFQLRIKRITVIFFMPSPYERKAKLDGFKAGGGRHSDGRGVKTARAGFEIKSDQIDGASRDFHGFRANKLPSLSCKTSALRFLPHQFISLHCNPKQHT